MNDYRIIDIANKSLLDAEISNLPVDIYKILENEPSIILMSYTQMCKTNTDITIDVLMKASEDGFVAKLNSYYLVLYNPFQYPEGRIRFTLAHEFGHIQLGHHIKSLQWLCAENDAHNTVMSNEIEKEANRFAAEFLSPIALIRQIRPKSAYEMSKIFGLSDYAAKNRYKYYLAKQSVKVSLSPTQYETLRSFQIHLDLQTYHELIKEYCDRCNNYHYRIDKKHCSICGLTKTEYPKYGGNFVIYDKLALDADSRMVVCIVCGNEDIDGGDHCKICGTHIVNLCSRWNCDSRLDGSARYCKTCGSASTFLLNKHLIEYNYCPEYLEEFL